MTADEPSHLAAANRYWLGNDVLLPSDTPPLMHMVSGRVPRLMGAPVHDTDGWRRRPRVGLMLVAAAALEPTIVGHAGKPSGSPTACAARRSSRAGTSKASISLVASRALKHPAHDRAPGEIQLTPHCFPGQFRVAGLQQLADPRGRQHLYELLRNAGLIKAEGVAG